jgi:diguanylate cyclase (GGDEF)-like protein
MLTLIFGTENKQQLRMRRHLAASSTMMLFTVMTFILYFNGLIDITLRDMVFVQLFFWMGQLMITMIIRSGLNKLSDDPSLTIPQLIWGALYLLTFTYLMTGWRSIMLMSFVAMFSFGFFRLRLREYISIMLFGVIGYFIVILYVYFYEIRPINIKIELVQLVAFSLTLMVMTYIGSSIHQLREHNKKQRAELEEALELNKKLATTDELSGLYNRRYFMEKLAQQKALSERDGSDFVICFFDLDHFKQINDQFGHQVGDTVLREFSDLLKGNIREIDYAARFGGEEFVCLLVNTDIEPAIKVAERIRHELEDHKFDDLAPGLRTTVSIGLANFKRYETLQQTLMVADNRMYEAKRQGRNKVVYEDPDGAESEA